MFFSCINICEGPEGDVKTKVEAINSTIYSPEFTKGMALYFVTVTQKTDEWTFSLLFVFQGHAIYLVCLILYVPVNNFSALPGRVFLG